MGSREVVLEIRIGGLVQNGQRVVDLTLQLDGGCPQERNLHKYTVLLCVVGSQKYEGRV